MNYSNILDDKVADDAALAALAQNPMLLAECKKNLGYYKVLSGILSAIVILFSVTMLYFLFISYENRNAGHGIGGIFYAMMIFLVISLLPLLIILLLYIKSMFSHVRKLRCFIDDITKENMSNVVSSKALLMQRKKYILFILGLYVAFISILILTSIIDNF